MTTVNEENKRDFERFISSKKDITDSTRETYENTLKRFIRVILNNDKRKIITKTKKEFLKEKLENLDASINTKIQYLQLYNGMFFAKNERNSNLLSYLKSLYEQNIKDTHKKTKEDLEKNEITYDDLNDMLDNATGQDYLALYILINYNVRNNDLIIKMTSSYIDDKNNIIYFDGDDKAIYIRRNYKTSERYGEKKHIIKDKKFLSILKEIKEGEFILQSKNNKPYEQGEISNFIKFMSNRYIKGAKLNQQLIYKIIVRHYEDKNDNNKLKSIANNRGHTRDTQETSYSTGEN